MDKLEKVEKKLGKNKEKIIKGMVFGIAIDGVYLFGKRILKWRIKKK